MRDYDIVDCGQGRFAVLQSIHANFEDCTEGDILNGASVVCSSESDAYEWIVGREDGRARARLVRLGSFVPCDYFADLAKRADHYRRCLSDLGRSVSTDLYHETTGLNVYFAGGRFARMSGGTTDNGWDGLMYFSFLIGIAESLFELGFVLVFDSEGRHSVKSRREQFFVVQDFDAV